MNIAEAMRARTKEKPFLSRAKWRIILLDCPYRPIFIQPTNTPEFCLLYGPSQKAPQRGWQPTAEDLMAEDWEVISGI